jgi:hypothetical protein
VVEREGKEGGCRGSLQPRGLNPAGTAAATCRISCHVDFDLEMELEHNEVFIEIRDTNVKTKERVQIAHLQNAL